MQFITFLLSVISGFPFNFVTRLSAGLPCMRVRARARVCVCVRVRVCLFLCACM